MWKTDAKRQLPPIVAPVACVIYNLDAVKALAGIVTQIYIGNARASVLSKTWEAE
jgi:hypothetical protein